MKSAAIRLDGARTTFRRPIFQMATEQILRVIKRSFALLPYVVKQVKIAEKNNRTLLRENGFQQSAIAESK